MTDVIAKLGTHVAPGFATYLASAPAEVTAEISAQFASFGVEKILEEYEAARAHEQSLATASSAFEILPAPCVRFAELNSAFKPGAAPAQTLRVSELTGDEKAELEALGLAALRAGEVAVVILAGGQGTRLGFAGPKGNYKLAVPSGASIYELLMGRVAALNKLVGGEKAVAIPVYIMTSEQNDAETQAHFEEHQYFGLARESVAFFKQTVMPSFDTESGAVLFESATTITRNPNGNGGVFASLKDRQVLAEMRARGVKYLHVHGIDNVIVKSADPLFIGACLRAGVKAGNKCCGKREAHEKVGVQVNKRETQTGRVFPSVVEYTEISAAQAEARDSAGALLYSAANIVNHFFVLEAVTAVELHYHVAHKKVPYFDFETRALVNPTAPNAVKLEYFIFDAFEALASLLVVEAAREEEFSPVKNAEGVDSPATACRDLGLLHARYLRAAKLVDEDDTALYEIAPGATFAGEGLSSATRFTRF